MNEDLCGKRKIFQEQEKEGNNNVLKIKIDTADGVKKGKKIDYELKQK